MNKPSVAIVTTGGTISSKYDVRGGEDVPAASAEELIASVPELAGAAGGADFRAETLPGCVMVSGAGFVSVISRVYKRSFFPPSFIGGRRKPAVRPTCGLFVQNLFLSALEEDAADQGVVVQGEGVFFQQFQWFD